MSAAARCCLPAGVFWPSEKKAFHMTSTFEKYDWRRAQHSTTLVWGQCKKKRFLARGSPSPTRRPESLSTAQSFYCIYCYVQLPSGRLQIPGILGSLYLSHPQADVCPARLLTCSLYPSWTLIAPLSLCRPHHYPLSNNRSASPCPSAFVAAGFVMLSR